MSCQGSLLHKIRQQTQLRAADAIDKKGKSGGIFNTELGTGILLHYLPESKWKTLSIDVFCKIPNGK